MAINLWEAGGKPTAYNPLPLSSPNLGIPIGKSYNISFKAKSVKRAILRVSSFGNTNDLHRDFNLTEQFQSYKVEWAEIESPVVYFVDLNNSGDIIIEDIKLVEKPLGIATINGIDGFLSGKWTLHPNATVIDDETLEHNNITGAIEKTTLRISVKELQGKIVTLKADTYTGNLQVYQYKNGSFNNTYFTLSTAKGDFLILNDTDELSIEIKPSTIGSNIYKRPMLHLGITPVPYEPKHGERMVEPVPVKNLFNGDFDFGYISTTAATETLTLTGLPPEPKTTKWIPCVGNGTYTIGGGDRAVWQCKNAGGVITFLGGSANDLGIVPTMKVSSDAMLLRVYYSRDGSHTQVQLEEGAVATPYSYAVQINKHSKGVNKQSVRVPKKNIFKGFVTETKLSSSSYMSEMSERKITHNPDTLKRNFYYLVDVEPNSNYFLSFKTSSATPNNGTIGVFDESATTALLGYYAVGNSFNTGAFSKIRIYFRNETAIEPVVFEDLQLEKGLSKTPFEPYAEVAKPSRTGVIMDGVTNYMQLPDMTMDSVEIDCLIDSVQPSPSGAYYFLDGRSGLANGHVHLNSFGSDWQTFLVDGVSKELVPSNIPRHVRTKLKFIANRTFMDNVNIFSNLVGGDRAKGIIYSVKCYLNGKVVAEYDFTKENPKANAVLFGNKTWNIKQAKR